MKYSDVSYSKLLEHPGFRIDAECYQEKYTSVEKELLTLKNTLLGDEAANLYKGIFDIKAESYSDAGIPFVRIGDLRDCIIDLSNITYIPQSVHKKNIKTALRKGDIILSKTGYPAASFVTLYECNTSQDTIALSLRKNSQIESEYLVVFLNSKFGFSQMERWFTGNVQMHLNLAESKNIIIPVIHKALQEKIKIQFSNVIRLKEQSIKKFKQAQTILLTELGLTDRRLEHHLAFVKDYSVVRQAERFDADYFQPKYEQIEEAIIKYPAESSLIKNEFKQNKTTFEIDDEKTYQYVEIGSVNVANGEITPSEVIGSDLPANAKRSLQRGDVIVSKVRTYRGAMSIVEEDGYVGSGAFTVLRENGRINKETLLAFLHSKPLLDWSLKPNTGTSYPVIVDDDILNLPIPLFPEELQTEIQKKVTGSFDLRKQSKRLLESAKRAVEIAIEQDEETAMEWLERETGEAGSGRADT